MSTFKDFNIPSELADSLERMEYINPTPIQAKSIPVALEGKDILGSAQTGTGKTAAFAIPLLTKLMDDPSAAAIVITPTRELAMQVIEVIRTMIGPKGKLGTSLLIGGAPMYKQLKALKRNPQVLVGTPGRINDHLDRGSLRLNNVKYLVLDETDRMLDMGFSVQIDAIVKHISKERQTLLFSATLPPSIVRLANKYMNNPERIAVDSVTTPVANIKQETIRVSEADKYDTLLDELDSRDGSILIFVKTRRGADQLAFKLSKKRYNAKAIHGDLRQRQRERTIKDYREEKFNILVATDVVSRGLDIPHIEHVINFDLPECPEDYIHRIGRTARAGATGCALTLVAPRDKGKLFAIERMLNPDKKASRDDRPSRSGSKRGGGGGSSFSRRRNSRDDNSRRKRSDSKPFQFKRHAKGGRSRTAA